MASSTIVNSWTEWGSLELICVGTAHGMCYPDETPAFPSVAGPPNLSPYLQSVVGPRPRRRIQEAQAQLDHLVDLLRAESITVACSIDDIRNEDIGEVLTRKQTSITGSSYTTDGRILQKNKIDVCRPTTLSNEQLRFDQQLTTPNFISKYQLGLTCPRDVLITLGDTIVEAPTAIHYRYFETEYYKTLLYSLWSRDSNMKWLQPPKPTCSPTRMFNDVDYWQKKSHSNSSYKTNLNETEIAFDAADIIRMGKDIFYKKSATANNQGLSWLRRTFPHLRFHMMHFPTSLDCHLDTSLVPLRPPTSGSPGIVLINQNRPPLVNEIKLFTDNDWRPVWGPLPATNSLPPFAMCSSNINLNLLSLNDHCVIIEECEVPLYRLLHDELGFDVITCPFRVLNEFGGSIHCVTWDIRRQGSCIDYFPNQNYEAECQLDLESYSDQVVLVQDTEKKF
ncbi:unnamed protein product [Rotaria socialis]|uniref:Glycine amidinotransferase n=2 Tax=Rotaria socialis TaxID=392032 RepID=A0A818WDS3_9BILA|nr:unnamed protein product [Rotaria socialis]CAF4421149.1 unnamed protein product [Rotaria socialis]